MKFLKIFFILYLASTLILPTQLLAAEELDKYMAKNEAEKDANRDVNKNCWFGAGMTVVGTGIAMMWHSSSPDPAVFTGRSPEYIRAYTDAYKSRARRIQTMYSCLGCATTLTIAGCALLAIEVNQSCQDWNEESCTIFPESCYSSSDGETTSCGEGSTCNTGSDGGSSCGNGSGG